MRPAARTDLAPAGPPTTDVAAVDRPRSRPHALASTHPGVRLGLAAALAVAIVGAPIVSVDGLIAPVSPARADVTVPRASALLVPIAFSALPHEQQPSAELPKELVGDGTPTSPADLAAASARALAVGSAQAHAAVPGCSGDVVNAGAANGRIDTDDLCALPWVGQPARLRGDAAVAIARLNAEYFQQFGQDLCVNDSYRSYEEQAAVRAAKPGLAAPAGASNHGWALALDLCGGVESDDSPQWAWMREHAPSFGWDNPAWALASGKGPHEPWHWEYTAGVAAQRAKAGLDASAAESARRAKSKGSASAQSSKARSSKAQSSKARSTKAQSGKTRSSKERSRG